MDDLVGQRSIAVIPARGGSKRIERKNILDFHGKPMVAWTIEAALDAGIFARVIVSTDDREIANVARQYGAAVPFFRKRYADDQSPVSLATIGTLEQLKDEIGEEYGVVVQLMPNCPLRKKSHIIEAFDHFMMRSARAQISCFKFGWMNPWWGVTLSSKGYPTSLFHNKAEVRSQDLPPVYCPTGAIWIADTQHLFSHRSFHSPDTIYWAMPWTAAVDIDDREDLRMAEVLHVMNDGQQ